MTVEKRPIVTHNLPSKFGSDVERDPSTIDTIVLHSMYNPNSNTPFSIEACKAVLDEYEVSAHYVIDREGVIWQLVPEERAAWHAGISRMPQPDGRTGIAHFSIGIELIGNETDVFSDEQYDSAIALSLNIISRRPIRNILGHMHIASAEVRPNDPKTDPWNFDWDRFKVCLKAGLGDLKALTVATQPL